MAPFSALCRQGSNTSVSVAVRLVSAGAIGFAEAAMRRKAVRCYSGRKRYCPICSSDMRPVGAVQGGGQQAHHMEFKPGQRVLLLLPSSSSKLAKWQGGKMEPPIYEIMHPEKGKLKQITT